MGGVFRCNKQEDGFTYTQKVQPFLLHLPATLKPTNKSVFINNALIPFNVDVDCPKDQNKINCSGTKVVYRYKIHSTNGRQYFVPYLYQYCMCITAGYNTGKAERPNFDVRHGNPNMERPDKNNLMLIKILPSTLNISII